MAVAVQNTALKPSTLSPLHRQNIADVSTASMADVERSPERSSRFQIGRPPPAASHHTTSNSHRPIRVRVYCNGDRFFRGKQVNIVASRYSSFGDLLSELTGRLPNGAVLTYGVRQIYTPVTGRRVRDIGQLRDGAEYVCAGFESFKPMKYGDGNLLMGPQQPGGENSGGDNVYYNYGDRHARTFAGTGANSMSIASYPTTTASGESSPTVNVLYPRRMTQPARQNRNNRQFPFLQQQTSSGYSLTAAAAANAAGRRATRRMGPLDSSATTPPGWAPGTDDRSGVGRGTSSSGSISTAAGSYHQPRVITIVKAAASGGGGRRPHDSLKTFVNRQNVQTYEQFARDVADAFEHGGGGQRQPAGDRRAVGSKKGSGARLFSVGGREVVGLSDLFRSDDVFIGIEPGSAEPSTSEVRQIFEELYPGSAYVDVLVRKWTKARQRYGSRRYGHAFHPSRHDDIAEETTPPDASKKSGRDSGVASTSPRRGLENIDELVDTDAAPEKLAGVAASRDSSAGRRRRRRTSNRVNFDDKENREHGQHAAAVAESDLNPDTGSVTSTTATTSSSKLPRAKRSKKAVHGGDQETASKDRLLPPINATRSDDRSGRTFRGDDNNHATSTTREQNPARHIPRKARAVVARRQLLPAIDGTSADEEGAIGRDAVRDRKVRLSYTNRKRADVADNKTLIRPPTAEKELNLLLSKSSVRSSIRDVRTAADESEQEDRRVDNDESANEPNVLEQRSLNKLTDDEIQKDENANEIIEVNMDTAVISVDGGHGKMQEFDGEPENADIVVSKKERRRSTAVFKTPMERQVSTVERVSDQYEIGKLLGDGNFAVVHKCRQRDSGREFALKIIDKSKMRGKEAMVENEITITKACRHTNIVRLYEEYETKTEIYLVMELVKGGDLFDTITQSTKFGEPEAARMVSDMTQALFYLHSLNIVHRDLKPENVLVHRGRDGGITLKLADFGLAMEVREPIFTICGTPTYVAPEILSQTGYGLEIDMWALGVILYILLCGFPPFRSADRRQSELFESIKAGTFEFLSPYWDVNSKMAKRLITKLLVVNRRKRYTAIDVLCDPFVLTVGGSTPLPDGIENVRQNTRSDLEARAKQYRVTFKLPSLQHG